MVHRKFTKLKKPALYKAHAQHEKLLNILSSTFVSTANFALYHHVYLVDNDNDVATSCQQQQQQQQSTITTTYNDDHPQPSPINPTTLNTSPWTTTTLTITSQ